MRSIPAIRPPRAATISGEGFWLDAGHGNHTAANDKLKALAASKNISLPPPASMGQMAEKAKLDVLTGDTYDKSFVNTQIKAHQQTIALFKKEIATGQDADAKAFASATLPTPRKHLKQAQSIAASLGNTKS